MQNFIIMTFMLSGAVFRMISQQQMYVLSRYWYLYWIKNCKHILYTCKWYLGKGL